MWIGVGVLLVVVCLLSAGVFFWAWRGKKIDDHPLCRRCGFDLTGKPEGSGQCSECGADVTRSGAVRVGHRVVRRGWLAGSGVVLVLGLLAGVGGGMVVYKRVDLTPYKPLFVLEREYANGTLTEQHNARAEIERRLDAGTLNPRRLTGTADYILDRQADMNKPWDQVLMGNLFLKLRKMGGVDDERYRRFARQIPVFSSKARELVMEGEAVPVNMEIEFRGGASWSGTQWSLYCTSEGEAWFDGDPEPNHETWPSWGMYSFRPPASSLSYMHVEPSQPAPTGWSGLKRGRKSAATRPVKPETVNVWGRVVLYDMPEAEGDPLRLTTRPSEQKVLARVEYRHTHRMRYASSPDEVTRPVTASLTADDLRKSIQILSASLSPQNVGGLYGDQTNNLDVFLKIGPVAEDLAYEVRVKGAPPPSKTAWFSLTSVAVPAGETAHASVNLSVPADLMDEIELEFIPSALIARRHVSIAKYLDQPFTYKVKPQWRGPPRNPATGPSR